MRFNANPNEKRKIANHVKKDAVIHALKTSSPSEINDWCDNQINPGSNVPAGVMMAFKIIFKVLAYLLRRGEE